MLPDAPVFAVFLAAAPAGERHGYASKFKQKLREGAMSTVITPLKPGESSDPEVNELLQQAVEGW